MNFFGENGLAFLLNWAVSGTMVVAVAEVVLFIWRSASAAIRHAVRVTAMISALVLPLVPWERPAAAPAVWTASKEERAGNEVRLSFGLAPGKGEAGVSAVHPGDPSEGNGPASYRRTVKFERSWAVFGMVLWASGVVIAFFPLVYAYCVERRRLMRAAQSATGTDWERLFREIRRLAGIRRPVFLCVSNEAIMPITWGTWRPVVLVPASASAWSEERKRLTLAHELAHVIRWDCFTQGLAQVVCALHWFNPLMWRSARALRLDREQACDDWVLSKACEGCKGSIYATHLVEIASMLRLSSVHAGISMARPSQLEQRVTALVARSRSRRAPGIFVRLGLAGAALAFVLAAGGQRTERTEENTGKVRAQQLNELKRFAAQKEKHAERLTEKTGEKIIPEFRKFFEAAKAGEWQTVTNMYADFRTRHSQYSGATSDLPHTAYWSTVLETCLAYTDVMWGEPEHVQMAIEGFMKSIPAGAVYFGGTDPGRGLPTAFSKNHAEADPFFTLTQNALADSSYLDYIRMTYGDRIYVPSAEDSAAAFNDYIVDVTARYHAGKLKPNENVSIEDGRTQVSGITAVMEINGRLAKVIFDKNPGRDFYIEESFPLEWMNPYLTPAGQVLRIHREPLSMIPEEVVQKDLTYWNDRLEKFLGTRIRGEVAFGDFVDWLDRVYVQRGGAGVDRRFVENDWAQRAFSKWRFAGSRLYAWRAEKTANRTERGRLEGIAEVALRQSVALCPSSPEALNGMVKFLASVKREADAVKLLEVSVKIAPEREQTRMWLSELKGKEK